jgi:outer membrane receptor protein involved in Fe transport
MIMSGVAAAALMPSVCSAQAVAASPGSAEARASTGASGDIEQVVVTGSRIVRDGYNAPTPVTVATTQDLLRASPTNLANALITLPQLANSSTNERGNHNNPASSESGNYLDLRGLGPRRTLILVDGIRIPKTTFDGNVDISLLPDQLVQRVDIVTGGASAAYGSDAVAGVVNFILDSSFKGLKGVAQGGISDYGDMRNARVGLAGGAKLGERVHVLGSIDFFYNEGILKSDRPKYSNHVGQAGRVPGGGGAGSAGNPLNPAVIDQRNTFHPYGGLITNGVLANTYFPTPGNFRPIITGTPTGTAGVFQGPISDYGFFSPETSGVPKTTNVSTFASVSYDLNDSTTVYARSLVSRFQQETITFPNLLLPGITVYADNAFLPSELRTRLLAVGQSSFNFAKSFVDNTYPRVNSVNESQIFLGGVKGEFGGFNWEVSGQYGRSAQKVAQTGVLEFRPFAAASDAVLNPVNNQPICRVLLDPDPAVRAQYAGCTPLNLFGRDAATDASYAYGTGTSRYKSVNETKGVAASISGDLFSLPAGAVAIAVGAEYRRETLALESNSNPAVPIPVPGLRNLTAASERFYRFNQGVADGVQTVREAFGEVSVPILRDLPLIESLSVDAAGRVTDYRTSGTVTTWKVGGAWQINPDIRFRVARSRDIRAPVLFELFAGRTQQQGGTFDPHTQITGASFIVSGGNPQLTPEIANTLTLGTVVEPRFVPGLTFSVDYYKIKLRDAIASPTRDAILNLCEASNGTGPECSLITRPLPFSDRSPANYVLAVQVSSLNQALNIQSGIDFDLAYRRELGPGQFSARLYSSYNLTNKVKASQTQPTLEGAGFAIPGRTVLLRSSSSLNVGYEIGRFRFNVVEQVLSGYKFSNIQVFSPNKTKAIAYTNATIEYSPNLLGRKNQIFLSINNVFNKDAPLVGSNSAGFGWDTSDVYINSVLGRRYTAGIRFSM